MSELTNKIVIIADNGGGVTLQIVNYNGESYQHYFDGSDGQLKMCAQCVIDAVSGDDPMEWEGNDYPESQWLEPTVNELQNGGYNTINVDCLHTVLEWGVDTSWHNVDILTDCIAELATP